jgi:hypothetical protein
MGWRKQEGNTEMESGPAKFFAPAAIALSIASANPGKLVFSDLRMR